MTFNLLSKAGRTILLTVPAGLAAWQVSAASTSWPLATANTAFAFDLMNQITQAQPDANVFISPFSVSSALQMVNNGAAGETKAEMQRVLKTGSLPTNSLNSTFADLNQQLTARKDVTLNLANGLWYQSGFHLKPAFTVDNQKYFQAGLTGVDFDKPEAAKAINDWADAQTKGKIKDVVQFPFPPATRLILANAIYFKGQWVNEFKKNLTQPRDFHLADGQTKQTPMMTQDGRFNYHETPEFQAVKLAYKGGMQIELYLPQTNSNPQKLLAGFMAGGSWQKDQMDFVGREGSVTLPKFKIEYEVPLNAPLKALGMRRAFAPDADFSGIADEPLFISEVKQKSYVDLNEEGTEAAAVTTVGVRASAMMMPPPDRFTMVLDRPFFFVISDVATGSLLFMGIVNDPANGG